MEITVVKTVFNSNLLGRVVAIKGFNEDSEDVTGVYFVRSVTSDAITLTPPTGGTVRLRIGDFSQEEPVQLKIISAEEAFDHGNN